MQSRLRSNQLSMEPKNVLHVPHVETFLWEDSNINKEINLLNYLLASISQHTWKTDIQLCRLITLIHKTMANHSANNKKAIANILQQIAAPLIDRLGIHLIHIMADPNKFLGISTQYIRMIFLLNHYYGSRYQKKHLMDLLNSHSFKLKLTIDSEKNYLIIPDREEISHLSQELMIESLTCAYLCKTLCHMHSNVLPLDPKVIDIIDPTNQFEVKKLIEKQLATEYNTMRSQLDACIKHADKPHADMTLKLSFYLLNKIIDLNKDQWAASHFYEGYQKIIQELKHDEPAETIKNWFKHYIQINKPSDHTIILFIKKETERLLSLHPYRLTELENEFFFFDILKPQLSDTFKNSIQLFKQLILEPEKIEDFSHHMEPLMAIFETKEFLGKWLAQHKSVIDLVPASQGHYQLFKSLLGNNYVEKRALMDQERFAHLMAYFGAILTKEYLDFTQPLAIEYNGRILSSWGDFFSEIKQFLLFDWAKVYLQAIRDKLSIQHFIDHYDGKPAKTQFDFFKLLTDLHQLYYPNELGVFDKLVDKHLQYLYHHDPIDEKTLSIYFAQIQLSENTLNEIKKFLYFQLTKKSLTSNPNLDTYILVFGDETLLLKWLCCRLNIATQTPSELKTTFYHLKKQLLNSTHAKQVANNLLKNSLLFFEIFLNNYPDNLDLNKITLELKRINFANLLDKNHSEIQSLLASLMVYVIEQCAQVCHSTQSLNYLINLMETLKHVIAKSTQDKIKAQSDALHIEALWQAKNFDDLLEPLLISDLENKKRWAIQLWLRLKYQLERTNDLDQLPDDTLLRMLRLLMEVDDPNLQCELNDLLASRSVAGVRLQLYLQKDQLGSDIRQHLQLQRCLQILDLPFSNHLSLSINTHLEDMIQPLVGIMQQSLYKRDLYCYLIKILPQYLDSVISYVEIHSIQFANFYDANQKWMMDEEHPQQSALCRILDTLSSELALSLDETHRFFNALSNEERTQMERLRQSINFILQNKLVLAKSCLNQESVQAARIGPYNSY